MQLARKVAPPPSPLGPQKEDGGVARQERPPPSTPAPTSLGPFEVDGSLRARSGPLRLHRSGAACPKSRQGEEPPRATCVFQCILIVARPVCQSISKYIGQLVIHV